MKRILISTALIAAAALVIPNAFSSTVTPQPLAERAYKEKNEAVEPKFEDSIHFKALEAYVLDAMRVWAPAATIAGTRSQDGFDAIARDIVAAVCDPSEPALFEGDRNRSRTAILLATVAYFEGHFWKYVDEGVCNDVSRKNDPILKNGNCDGGTAYSQWQIHPGRGIVLFSNGLYGYRVTQSSDKGSTTGGRLGRLGAVPRAAAEAPPSVDPLSEHLVATAETLRDRRFAAKVALHMLRASLRRDGTLCEYTGELKPCEKAKKRLAFAKAWSEQRPYRL